MTIKLRTFEYYSQRYMSWSCFMKNKIGEVYGINYTANV